MTVLAVLDKLLQAATKPPWYNICGEISKPEVDLFTCPYVAIGQERRARLEEDAALVVALRNHGGALVAVAKAASVWRELLREGEYEQFDTDSFKAWLGRCQRQEIALDAALAGLLAVTHPNEEDT